MAKSPTPQQLLSAIALETNSIVAHLQPRQRNRVDAHVQNINALAAQLASPTKTKTKPNDEGADTQ